jgi:hypothetical protein
MNTSSLKEHLRRLGKQWLHNTKIIGTSWRRLVSICNPIARLSMKL